MRHILEHLLNWSQEITLMYCQVYTTDKCNKLTLKTSDKTTLFNGQKCHFSGEKNNTVMYLSCLTQQLVVISEMMDRKVLVAKPGFRRSCSSTCAPFCLVFTEHMAPFHIRTNVPPGRSSS